MQPPLKSALRSGSSVRQRRARSDAHGSLSTPTPAPRVRFAGHESATDNAAFLSLNTRASNHQNSPVTPPPRPVSRGRLSDSAESQRIAYQRAQRLAQQEQEAPPVFRLPSQETRVDHQTANNSAARPLHNHIQAAHSGSDFSSNADCTASRNQSIIRPPPSDMEGEMPDLAGEAAMRRVPMPAIAMPANATAMFAAANENLDAEEEMPDIVESVHSSDNVLNTRGLFDPRHDNLTPTGYVHPDMPYFTAMPRAVPEHTMMQAAPNAAGFHQPGQMHVTDAARPPMIVNSPINHHAVNNGSSIQTTAGHAGASYAMNGAVGNASDQPDGMEGLHFGAQAANTHASMNMHGRDGPSYPLGDGGNPSIDPALTFMQPVGAVRLHHLPGWGYAGPMFPVGQAPVNNTGAPYPSWANPAAPAYGLAGNINTPLGYFPTPVTPPGPTFETFDGQCMPVNAKQVTMSLPIAAPPQQPYDEAARRIDCGHGIPGYFNLAKYMTPPGWETGQPPITDEDAVRLEKYSTKAATHEYAAICKVIATSGHSHQEINRELDQTHEQYRNDLARINFVSKVQCQIWKQYRNYHDALAAAKKHAAMVEKIKQAEKKMQEARMAAAAAAEQDEEQKALMEEAEKMRKKLMLKMHKRYINKLRALKECQVRETQKYHEQMAALSQAPMTMLVGLARAQTSNTPTTPRRVQSYPSVAVFGKSQANNENQQQMPTQPQPQPQSSTQQQQPSTRRRRRQPRTGIFHPTSSSPARAASTPRRNATRASGSFSSNASTTNQPSSVTAADSQPDDELSSAETVSLDAETAADEGASKDVPAIAK